MLEKSSHHIFLAASLDTTYWGREEDLDNEYSLVFQKMPF